MNIDIQAKAIPAHKDVHHFVACRADLALGGMRDQLALASVFIDGSGAGDEVRCLVMIRPYAQPDIIVEGSHANVYVAVHQTLDEAGWTLARKLASQQNAFIDRQFELLGDQAARSGMRGLPLSGRAA